MSMMNLTVARGILSVAPVDARRPVQAFEPVTLPSARRPVAEAKSATA